MKKALFLLGFSVILVHAIAQTTKPEFMISLQGDFTHKPMGMGTTTDMITVDGKYLNIEAFVGLFTMKGFLLGIGMDYKSANEETYSNLYINKYIQIEFLDSKSHVLIPTLNFGYFHRIVNELYFNLNLKTGYGLIRTEYETGIAGSTRLPNSGTMQPVDEWQSYVRAMRNSEKYDYFMAGLYPQVTYFIKGHWGLCLSMGGIEYGLTEWENSDLLISFKPSYWNLGLKMKF